MLPPEHLPHCGLQMVPRRVLCRAVQEVELYLMKDDLPGGFGVVARQDTTLTQLLVASSTLSRDQVRDLVQRTSARLNK